MIPGISLAVGCIFLPPSPRLLVAQGCNDEALRTLAKIRLRSENEIQDDPLLQVRQSATLCRTVLTISAFFLLFHPPGFPPGFVYVFACAGYGCVYQIEMLEMQVEARLVRQIHDSPSAPGTRAGEVGLGLGGGEDHLKSRSTWITAEVRSWMRLFSGKYIDRTWIGILIMVFQREHRVTFLLSNSFPCCRSGVGASG